MALAIKKEHKDTRVGFKNSVAPLGERSAADLVFLAQLAHTNAELAVYFEELPTLAELKAAAGRSFLDKNEKPAPAG